MPTKDQILGYDVFKAMVAVVLAITLALMILQPPAKDAHGGSHGGEKKEAHSEAKSTSASEVPFTLTIVQPAEGATVDPTGRKALIDAKPGEKVTVMLNDQLVGEKTVPTSGLLDIELPYRAGSNVITVKSGNNSVKTTVTYTETAPVLTMDNPKDGAALGSGGLTLRGTAKPGAQVELRRDGEVLTTVTAGADGKWTHKVNHTAGITVYTANSDGLRVTANIAAP